MSPSNRDDGEAGMDVLIVDDDPDVQRTHGRLLERAGFTARAVDNGLAAFAELQRHEFSAILCDIFMPFLEGRTFFHQLQQDFPGQAARVIFVSGYPDNPETEDFLAQTGRPFLAKPVDPDELIQAVRKVAAQP
jgi:CheY-like chemotaxis protein